MLAQASFAKTQGVFASPYRLDKAIHIVAEPPPFPTAFGTVGQNRDASESGLRTAVSFRGVHDFHVGLVDEVLEPVGGFCIPQ